MPHSLAIEALLITAHKRQMLDAAGAADLSERLTKAGVATAEELRRWLVAESRNGGPLARLLSTLPQGERRYGTYSCLAHLADGGMGSVWLAERKGELVVVKTIKGAQVPVGNVADASEQSIWLGAGESPAPAPTPGTRSISKDSSSSDLLKRFEREAKLTRQLQHPNVVCCLDHGRAIDGQLFLVLEYVGGGDLRDLVLGSGSLSERRALELAGQVCDGLAMAHQFQLIHRDLKPNNIFIASDGTAKLADFGFARSTRTDRTQLTMQGATIGSPAYMAPEQVEPDCELDIRTDLYALGGVLYFCLTGLTPYRGSIPEILHQHRFAPTPNVLVTAPHVSTATAALISRAMAKHPDERFPDPASMRAAITAALATAPHTQPPAPGETSTIHLAPGRVAAEWSKSGTDRHEKNVPHATPSPQPVARSASSSALEVTVPLARLAEATSDGLDGVLGNGLAADWLCLDGDGLRLLLYARPRLVLGKFKDLSVDVCLRNYPVDDHKEMLQKLSRAHVAIAYDHGRGQVQIEDLDSINGSVLDGDRLPAQQPRVLATDRDHALTLAKVVKLNLRVVPCRDQRREPVAGHPASASTRPGLDGNHRIDGIAITRSENRQQLAYAMVIRRMSLGGSTADLALPGIADGVRSEIGRLGGAWVWRPTPQDAWRPLAIGDELTLGSARLGARAGTLGDF